MQTWSTHTRTHTRARTYNEETHTPRMVQYRWKGRCSGKRLPTHWLLMILCFYRNETLSWNFRTLHHHVWMTWSDCTTLLWDFEWLHDPGIGDLWKTATLCFGWILGMFWQLQSSIWVILTLRQRFVGLFRPISNYVGWVASPHSNQILMCVGPARFGVVWRT